VVPLTNRACRTLAAWLRRFSDSDRSSYVFPLHRIGMAGASRKTLLWGMDFNRLMGQWSYKAAFETARQKCGIACRFYDARHTFITRLAENPTISMETISPISWARERANDGALRSHSHPGPT
jgi:integrase